MNLYQWQRKASEKLKNKNGILSAPTGAGKTIVAYSWAGLIDNSGIIKKPEQRIIFTAPIKALSNERYLELKKMGIDVGIETGDFKQNNHAPVLCCTQEIYTNKYANIENQLIIIDEFLYISSDPGRARAYIDGIINTHPTSKTLVMSATFGKPEEVKDYLERIRGKDFELFQTNERVTELVLEKKPVDITELHNALVFVFSRRGVDAIAAEIMENRELLPTAKLQRLEELANIFTVEPELLPYVFNYGIGTYYGSMLPKLKLLVETAFREGILDLVVGTDALALGVNLPAETVVFAQLAKYYDGPINTNQFYQMAGRAGRKGFYEKGYVSYYASEHESFEYDTNELYAELLTSDLKPMSIRIDISIRNLIKETTSIKKEAEYVAQNSLPVLDANELEEQITFVMKNINFYINDVANDDEQMSSRLKKLLAEIYYPEFSVSSNIELAILFTANEIVSLLDIVYIICQDTKNDFYALLQAKKYLNSLSMRRLRKKVKDMSSIDNMINEIDPTIMGFEEILKAVGR